MTNKVVVYVNKKFINGVFFRTGQTVDYRYLLNDLKS